MSFNLSEQQDEAVFKIREWYADPDRKQVFWLAGLAGTGKSYLIAPIIDALGIDPSQIALVGPTAMAAKVVRQKLEKAGLVADTSTIHSAIYQVKPLKAEVLEAALQSAQTDLGRDPGNKVLAAKVRMIETNLDRAYDLNDVQFRLNPDSTVTNCRLIIVDESSMVGKLIADDLRAFGIPILAIGDHGQLQPVEDDPGLCIGKPDYALTEIHRQAADNPIILYAHLLRQGEQMPFGDYGPLKIIRPRQDDYTLDPARTAQVICGMNKTRWDLTASLRRLNGFEGPTPQHGEPLIICRNSRTIPSLINGAHCKSLEDHADLTSGRGYFSMKLQDEQGAAHRIKAYQGIFEEHLERVKGASSLAALSKKANFQARKVSHHVDFGWVMTCHKAQGSGWPSVIVHDEGAVFREEVWNWRYTAATRAENELIVIRRD